MSNLLFSIYGVKIFVLILILQKIACYNYQTNMFVSIYQIVNLYLNHVSNLYFVHHNNLLIVLISYQMEHINNIYLKLHEYHDDIFLQQTIDQLFQPTILHYNLQLNMLNNNYLIHYSSIAYIHLDCNFVNNDQ